MGKLSYLFRTVPAFFAAFMLVTIGASQIDLRFCLDGSEAPVSVQFKSTEIPSLENTSEVQVGDSSTNIDIEVELTLDSLLTKLAKLSADSMAIIPAEFSLATCLAKLDGFVIKPAQLSQQPEHFLPPSRAPPELI